MSCDVSNYEQVKAVAQKLKADRSKVDGLIRKTMHKKQEAQERAAATSGHYEA